jgi:hypothetical protein
VRRPSEHLSFAKTVTVLLGVAGDTSGADDVAKANDAASTHTEALE